jgi:NADH:ubiquinone oxidoreductase subunit F (NADH-binding)
MLSDAPSQPASDALGGRGSPPAGGPARLLADVHADGTWTTLAEHRSRYSPPPAPKREPDDRIIDLVDEAGLRGRGGAGFPTGRKLRTVSQGRAPRIVIGNGTEGEPASAKDRLLMSRLPHLVIDGALLAAAAVGADRIGIGVERNNTEAVKAMRDALAERAEHEPLPISFRVAGTPPRYVGGEETGLVHWFNNGPAMPTFVPPLPFEKGVDGRPTLVQNVESLAHITQIVAHGPDWFREVGTAEEPGTALATVSGAVNRASVVEAAIGTPIGKIVESAGGSTARIGAMLLGGFFGTWVRGDAALAAPFSRAGLSPLNASPGAGIMCVLSEDACGLAETARILAWFAAESAGQCGPCLYGLADLARGAAGLSEATSAPSDLANLFLWAHEIEGRGACKHPDGAVRLLRSAATVFAEDWDRHARGERCRGQSAPPTIRVPVPPPVWR